MSTQKPHLGKNMMHIILVMKHPKIIGNTVNQDEKTTYETAKWGRGSQCNQENKYMGE
jgi:hypothetical protein